MKQKIWLLKHIGSFTFIKRNSCGSIISCFVGRFFQNKFIMNYYVKYCSALESANRALQMSVGYWRDDIPNVDKLRVDFAHDQGKISNTHFRCFRYHHVLWSHVPWATTIRFDWICFQISGTDVAILFKLSWQRSSIFLVISRTKTLTLVTRLKLTRGSTNFDFGHQTPPSPLRILSLWVQVVSWTFFLINRQNTAHWQSEIKIWNLKKTHLPIEASQIKNSSLS